MEIFHANYILYFFPIKGDKVAYWECKANPYVSNQKESTNDVSGDSVLSDEEIGGIDSIEYEDLETYLIEYVLEDNYNEIVHKIEPLETWVEIKDQYGVCEDVIKLFSYNNNTYNRNGDGNTLMKGTNQLIPLSLSKKPEKNPKYYKLIESVNCSELVVLLEKNKINTNYRMKSKH